MKRTKKAKKIEAKMFRCKNCQRRLNRELREAAKHPWTKKDDQWLNKLLAKAEKGIACSDCFRTFKKADKKYEYDVTLLK